MNQNSKLVTLEKELFKLDSWYKVLETVDNFFDATLYEEHKDEIKCEEMIKNYYAVEQVFTLFYKDYGTILESIHILNTKKDSKVVNIKVLKGGNENEE